MISSVLLGPEGAVIGGALGSGIGYLADIASKIDSNWKPVIFGNWLEYRIKKYMDDK